MLNVYHSPAHLFLSFHLSLPAQHHLQRLSQLQQSPFPLYFPFQMWLSLLMLHPIIGPFIFRVLGFLYPVVEPDQILCARLMLLCKQSKLLHSCYIKWPFGYLIRWLSYIYLSVWRHCWGIVIMLQWPDQGCLHLAEMTPHRTSYWPVHYFYVHFGHPFISEQLGGENPLAEMTPIGTSYSPVHYFYVHFGCPFISEQLGKDNPLRLFRSSIYQGQ